MAYENNQDLMIRLYEFVANEEMACEEAKLGPDKFAEKTEMQKKLQEPQLEMLKHMRNFHVDDQSAILEKLRQQMGKPILIVKHHFYQLNRSRILLGEGYPLYLSQVSSGCYSSAS